MEAVWRRRRWGGDGRGASRVCQEHGGWQAGRRRFGFRGGTGTARGADLERFDSELIDETLSGFFVVDQPHRRRSALGHGGAQLREHGDGGLGTLKDAACAADGLVAAVAAEVDPSLVDLQRSGARGAKGEGEVTGCTARDMASAGARMERACVRARRSSGGCQRFVNPLRRSSPRARCKRGAGGRAASAGVECRRPAC